MKKLAILSLVGVLVLASAGDAFAQYRGRGWGRGWGGGWNGGWSQPYHYGYHGGYYPYRSNWAGGYYPYGYGYYPSTSYYSSPSYYTETTPYTYSSPSYVYTEPAPSVEARQSFYMDPSSAMVTVVVPTADTQVWFDNTQMQQRGMERTFATPALQRPGVYNIKARWTDNGRTVDRERVVTVQPGQSARVEFRSDNY